jgi:L-seryl-tRNA(Ser) seleniumtransferase
MLKLSDLPSVDEVVQSLHGVEAPRTLLVSETRRELSAMRAELVAGIEVDPATTADRVRASIAELARPSLTRVINATGVVLHTNLGRAPLAASALEHVREASSGYSNLEFDVETGERGKRVVHVDGLFRKLLDGVRVEAGLRPARTGRSPVPTQSVPAQSVSADISTIVVNNNAAAVLLALNTLAEGGEVIVSRGELVEIGGSFRIPDVMAKSSATLREVGTTNRTRLSDYERAINEKTRLLLRVHRSNFEITGFTEQPGIHELSTLAHERKIPLMEDLGSGALFDLNSVGVRGEPSVLGSLQAGVDVVSYSGDKLLGGPQAGILSGRSDLIARMRANSLFRAVRVDKLTYAALETTLLAYVKRDYDAIPALRMMHLSKDEIGERAEAIAAKTRSLMLAAEVVDGESVIGGGAAPSAVLPTRLLAVSCAGLSADELSARLRASDPPIIARVEEGRVLLDLRTVFPEQDERVIAAIDQLAR